MSDRSDAEHREWVYDELHDRLEQAEAERDAAVARAEAAEAALRDLRARIEKHQDVTGLIEKACDWLTMHAPQPDPTMQQAVDLLDFFVKAGIAESEMWADVRACLDAPKAQE